MNTGEEQPEARCHGTGSDTSPVSQVRRVLYVLKAHAGNRRLILTASLDGLTQFAPSHSVRFSTILYL